MTMKRVLAVTSAALLLSVSFLPAQAFDLSVGGVSVGGGSGSGSTINVGTSGSTGSGTLGGGTNIASATVGADGNAVVFGIGNTTGPLVTATSQDGTTAANVNLGSAGLGGVNDPLNDLTAAIGDLLDNATLPGGGGGGNPGTGGDFPGVIPRIELVDAYGGLSGGEQLLLRNRCQAVLIDPVRYERNLVELCRILKRMQVPGG